MKPIAWRHHARLFAAGTVALLAIAGWWWAGTQTAPGEGGAGPSIGTAQPVDGKPSNLPCSKVLGCVAGRAIDDAGKQCRPQIEQLAVFAPRWTNKPGDSIFVDYLWLQQDKGTLTFQGRHAEFQDAGGRFGPVAYECDYDPATRTVLNVRVTTASR